MTSSEVCKDLGKHSSAHPASGEANELLIFLAQDSPAQLPCSGRVQSGPKLHLQCIAVARHLDV